MTPAQEALVVLVQAYKTRHAPAADATDNAVIERFLLQQIHSSALSSALDEVSVTVRPSLLLALVRAEIKAKEIEGQLVVSERNSATAWKAIDDARAVMQSKRNGTPNERASAALKALGLSRPPRNKGVIKPLYQEAADLYFNLRSGGDGGLVQIDGVLQKIKPHSHDDAVAAVEKLARISWASLNRAWVRHGIRVSTTAEVFPVRTARRTN